MQYIKLKYQTDEVDLFSDDDMDGDIQPIPREDYERLIEFLQDYNPPAILPIQIAYYAGLRIGEACGLAGLEVLPVDCNPVEIQSAFHNPLVELAVYRHPCHHRKTSQPHLSGISA